MLHFLPLNFPFMTFGQALFLVVFIALSAYGLYRYWRWDQKQLALIKALEEKEKAHFEKFEKELEDGGLEKLIHEISFALNPEAAAQAAKFRNEMELARAATAAGMNPQDFASHRAEEVHTRHTVEAGVNQISQIFELQKVVLAQIEQAEEQLAQGSLSQSRKDLLTEQITVLKAQYVRLTKAAVSQADGYVS